jgi:hypothetical protein
LESLFHHIGKVRPENINANSFGEGAHGIHGDSTKLLFCAFTLQNEEMLETFHGRLEVGQELRLGSMGCTADGTGDDGLDSDGSRFEEPGKTLHNKLKILIYNILKDL